jgi:4a-hydroxytetrahydrobiopterin dehydratase
MSTTDSTRNTTNEEKTKCVPCESLDKSTLLTKTEIQDAISSSIPLWCVNEIKNDNNNINVNVNENEGSGNTSKISRSFTAKNFQSALDFLNQVGKIAERESHHPDLHLTSYREVEIVLFTHSVGGLTKNDLLLAKMIDTEVKVLYSPKWLLQHPDAKGTAL